MKLLIVDDHSLFRESLKLILLRLDDIVDIHEAGSVEQAIGIHKDVREFDLILLDLQLPGLHGLAGMVALQKCYPASALVLLSGSSEPNIVQDSISRGAQGFVSKSVNVETMLHALRQVMNGELWIPLEYRDQHENAENNSKNAPSPLYLTPRQQDVLAQLAQGHSNKEIGQLLNMSENTVRSHMAVVLRSLGAKSRTEAVILAKRNGLL